MGVDGTHIWTVLRCVSVPQRSGRGSAFDSGRTMSNLGVRFDGGQVTSDGGLPWMVEAETALGVCAALAARVPEWRRGGVRHSLERAGAPAGVPDRVRLRRPERCRRAAHGPGVQAGLWAAAGQRAQTWRASRRSPGWRTRSIAMPSSGSRRALVDLYIRERGRAGVPARILLDLDGTADPAHGEQEGVAYHGYYRQHMYHPLLVFDGDTGQLITRRPPPRQRPRQPLRRAGSCVACSGSCGQPGRTSRSSCGPTAALPCRGCSPGARRTASATPSA